jgi:hypothetical protein
VIAPMNSRRVGMRTSLIFFCSYAEQQKHA